MATTRLIGLDIGSEGIRAAQVAHAGGRRGASTATLERFGEVALPLGAVRDGEVTDHPTVVRALKELWSRHKFGSREVVLGIGNHRVLVRDVELPSMPRAEYAKTLPFQVNELLPMAVEDALLDYCPTAEFDGAQGRSTRGLLVAARRDTVTGNVMAVDSAGLRPAMVDLGAFALIRALTRSALREHTAAIVDIGASATAVIIAVQGQPALVRYLPSGGFAVTSAVANTLGIGMAEAEQIKRNVGVGFVVPPEHAAVAEAIGNVVRSQIEAIRNTIVFYTANNPGSGLDRITVTGRGALLPGLGQYLSSATRLPVSLADPLSDVRLAKGVTRASLSGQEPAVALALGLAFGVPA